MKKTFTILAILLLTISIWAQSPNKLSYQAVVRNADDNLVVSQAVQMQMTILQGSASGTEVYMETHTTSTNANGLVSIEIGDGTTTDDFSTIDWASGPYFIKTEIDPTGGTDYTITATSQLLSVPYAKYADKAGNTFSGDYADLSNAPANVSDFTNDAGYITDAGFEVEGNVKFGSSGIVISELREITGTTHSYNHYTIVSLPEGYTAENTRVLSIEINYLGSSWKGIGHDNINPNLNSLSYGLSESSLYIYHYNDASHLTNRAFRALIMKVE